MNFNKNNKVLIAIPAIIMFFIALIPTLKYQWPLSWDIIYHIGFAKIYSQYGLIDPLFTHIHHKITYPPLFHLLIAALGNTLHVDYFQIARCLQPIFAMLIVLSVSYIAKKLYGNLIGISAGFLIISSYIAFRIMLPLPENLALLFFIFSVYFFYISISKKILKYALISGILLLLTLATHQVSPLILISVASSFTVLELIVYKNKFILMNYGAFLLPIILLIICGISALLLLKPGLLNNILQQGISTYIGHITAYSSTQSLSILKYLRFLGVFVSIFSFIGAIVALKTRDKKGIFILTWAIVIFLLSNAYLVGINVESSRFLIYMLVPLSILGGYGLNYVYYKFKEYKYLSSPKFRSGFLMSIFALSVILGLLTVAGNPFTFYAETPLGTVQIAPLSPSEIDLANWFKMNGDKNESILISNPYSGYFVSDESGMSINEKFKFFNKSTSQSDFKKNKIGYIVYDKRLTFQSKNGTLYMQEANSELYPLLYFSKDIHANINEIIPSFAKVVYENNDFIVCKIE